VRKALRGRGASIDQIDDALQEAAIRVLTSRVQYTDADDLAPWAVIVARRVVIDEWRRSRRFVGDIAGESAGGHRSTEDVVDAKLSLREAVDAIRTLSAADQAELMAVAFESGEGAGPLSSKLKVRRHRARQRLLRALGPFGALVGWLRVRVRRPPRPAGILALAACVGLPLIPLFLSSPSPRGTSIPVPRSTLDVKGQFAASPPVRPASGSPAGGRAVRMSTSPPGHVGAHPPGFTTPEIAGLPTDSVTVRPKQRADHILCVLRVPLVGDRCFG
jgi:DNA-directed RNA polymerase specialized sigma24 family protein